MQKICGAVGPDGFLCVLADGHEGDHLSIDNREMWKGTPGKPVRWAQERRGVARVVVSDEYVSQVDCGTFKEPPAPAQRTKPLGPQTAASVAKAKGFTGIPCELCGSLETVRIGTCLRCNACGSSGGCG